jgi:hypothetical protein
VKLALIPPPANAAYMLETKYQLLLPHYFEHPTYKATVKVMKDRGHFMMLDNGAAEGKPVDKNDLYRLAAEYGCKEIIVPDVYGDMEATWAIAKHFIPSSHFKHQVVLAVKTYEEAFRLLVRLDELNWVDTIGIPRLVLEHGLSRALLTGMVSQFHPQYEIHWLGSNRNACLWEHLTWPTVASIVRGVDTAKPFAWAAAILDLKREWDAKNVPAIPDDYVFSVGSIASDLLRWNIRHLRELCNA